METLPLSAEVEAYEPVIRKYAKQYGIPDYVLLIQAVMMQESGGRGNDPMQASECWYNTQYARRYHQPRVFHCSGHPESCGLFADGWSRKPH